MEQKEKILIIRNQSGEILELSRENEKGFKKTIENNQLWCIHPGTGRLIPHDLYGSSGKYREIKLQNDWYEAVVDTAEDTSTEKMPSAKGAVEITESHETQISGTVLEQLATVITDRHLNMPEGSYTTHLFSSGEEKIRKKTGEEAVELILAREDSEIVYEAADLIYHMLVLLEERKIPLSMILDELEKRSK